MAIDACNTGPMAILQILCLDVCVKGHQESNLKPQSEDRSFGNAPARASLLYFRLLHQFFLLHMLLFCCCVLYLKRLTAFNELHELDRHSSRLALEQARGTQFSFARLLASRHCVHHWLFQLRALCLLRRLAVDLVRLPLRQLA
jgi:hypothetical protein